MPVRMADRWTAKLAVPTRVRIAAMPALGRRRTWAAKALRSSSAMPV